MTLSSEILSKCKHIRSFVGVFPADKLPKIKQYPVCLIMNTHTSDKPGEHWVAVYINENGFGEYFDSYGLPPLIKYFTDFLDNNCPNGWTYNTKTIQWLTSINCGKYCVFYLWLRDIDISTYNIMRIFSTLNQQLNDDVIDEFYNLFPCSENR